MSVRSQVFVSYCHEDQDFVKQLVEALSSKAPEIIFYYDTLLRPGEQWSPRLAREMHRSDACIVVLSGNVCSTDNATGKVMITRDWVKREVEWARFLTHSSMRPIPF